jgi:hypothetical protein
MGDGATTNKPQRAVTRMWPLLQRLGQLRDLYSRDQSEDGRREKARRLVELVEDLRALAAEVLREAEGGMAGTPPTTGEPAPELTGTGTPA